MSEQAFKIKAREEASNLYPDDNEDSERRAFRDGALWAEAELQEEMNAIWRDRSMLDDANIDLNYKIQELRTELEQVKNKTIIQECQIATSYTEEEYKALQLTAESYRAKYNEARAALTADNILDVETNSASGWMIKYQRQLDHNNALKSENDRLRAALEFYAKHTKGPYHTPKDGNYMSVDNDGGSVARAALAKGEKK